MNDIYVGALFSEAYLEHHGILGMKWGVRRFQNKDGSLTSVGKKRKSSNENKRRAYSDRANKDKSVKSNGKKLAIAAAAALGVGLAAYGAYKLHDSRTPKLVNTGESKTKELFGATFKPSTFEPTRFEPTRIDIPRVSVPRTDVPRTNISRTEVERTEIPRVSFKDMTIDDLKKMDLW